MDPPSEPPEIELRISAQRRVVDEWALVLLAEGLRPSVRRARGGFALAVPTSEAARGEDVLAAYERENPVEPASSDRPRSLDLRIALIVWAAVLGFFAVTGPRNPERAWFERGSADAERILLGETWRAVTALTLHADLAHALGNALAGILFVGAVAAALGPGVGCALVLLAGATGNLANAALHGSGHVSLGASTAVFAAVGLLGGLAVRQRRRHGARGRRAWLPPLAAGLALLALLGTTGERTDVWGHVCGLLAGGVLGITFLPLARPPGPWAQWASGVAALWALVWCWRLALD